jgi:pyridoxal biosynthesis lyase PdxS
MTLIHVPRPDVKTAMNPNRPVNALLKAQIQHLQEAELKLPLAQQTDIYVNAIKTEGEAADYIRRVTEAIREAHEAAAMMRAKPKRKPGIAIAAVAEQGSIRKRTSATSRTSRTKAKPKRKS